MKNTVNIIGIADTGEIFVDGKKLDPKESQAVYNHSPDGFAWGYCGSGPAQAALAILLATTDRGVALATYQEFKRKILSLVGMEYDFEMDIDLKRFLSFHDRSDLKAHDFIVSLVRNKSEVST